MKSIFGGHSIRRTLMFILLLTSSSALFVTALGFVANDWLMLRQDAVNQLRSQADIVSKNSAAAVVFADNDAAKSTLISLESQPDLVGAVIFDRDGQRFAEYQQLVDFTLPGQPPGAEVSFSGRLVVVTQRIDFESATVGTLMLVSRLQYWNRPQIVKLVTAFGVFVFSLIWVIVLSSYLQRIVLRPIVKLAQTTKQITGSGDFQLRADKLSQDEIGDLVDDFNEMLRQIQMRDSQLHRVQEALEEKVEERTRELTELTTQLERQAYFDTLTGLANRMTFDNHLQLAVRQARRYGGELAVLFIDLDRFKTINDTLGHAVGDKLLIEASQRFQQCLRDSDMLARLGGDEFAVLLVQMQSVSDVGGVAQKLIENINSPFFIDGFELHVTTSIGISVFPADGDEASTMLKNADTAMYHSKASGRNQFSFFTAPMNSRTTRRQILENKLRTAIELEQLTLHYQPLYNTHSRALVGVEALVRWTDSEEGEIPADELVVIADECGLIAAIDEWVLEASCREVLSWYDQCKPEIRLSVNLSAAQFIRRDLSQVIGTILRQTGFPGDCLELDISEDVFGPNTADVSTVLTEIRALGVELAIDNFGKAYTSLSRMRQLPLQTLKIDKTFVQDIGVDSAGEMLVRAIISLAHSLNMKVVAEGVENDTQYRYIKAHQCDGVQGYMFGRPVTGNEIRRLLALDVGECQ